MEAIDRSSAAMASRFSRHADNSARKRRGRHVVVFVAVVGALTACGSSDEASDEYTVEQFETDTQKIGDQYRQCMSDNGIEIPEFDDRGGNAVDGSAAQADIDLDDYDSDIYDAAEIECSPILENLPSLTDTGTPEMLAASEDWEIEVQNCVAEKGYALPVTQADGNTVEDTRPRDDLLPSEGDAFEDAVTECEQAIELPEILQADDD